MGRLVPDCHRFHAHEAQRASLIFDVGLCLGLVCAFFALFYLAFDLVPLALGLALLSLTQLLSPLTLRLTRSLEVTAQLSIGTCFIGFIAGVWFTGGPTSTGAPWAISIPMIALFLSGWRACIFWTSATLAAFVGFGAAVSSGFEFPSLSSAAPLWLRSLLSNGLLFLSAFAMLGLYERSRREVQTRLNRANDELARARDSALDQAHRKSEFLATVSHEIRTPMNAVIGLSELLLGSPLTEAQRNFARTIRASSHDLLRMIEDVLSFARNEAPGVITPELSSVDLNTLVETITDLLAESAHRKGLEVWSQIETSTPAQVRTDVVRLRQVLVNLLGNAIKFTEHGEVVLRIRSTATSHGRAKLRFEVQDSGVGLPSQSTDVFEPFARARETAVRVEGTGLGLSISKQQVEILGGIIGAQNRPSGGALFWFEVPMEVEAEAAPVTRRDGPFVLALEPSAEGRAALSLALSRLGVPHEVAPSFEAREREARGRRAEILITRLESTGETSSSWTRLRQEPELCGAEFILLARLSQTIDEWPDTLGVATVLGRPVRKKELESAIFHPGQRESSAGSMPGLASKQEVGRHVLVVDDNAVNRRVIELQLQALGHRATSVGSGEAALDVFPRDHFDVVVMDARMPGLSGVEATREIRNLEGAENARCTIIALTASVVDGERARFMAAGADLVLSKPIELATLRRTLEGRTSSTLPDRTRHPANREARGDRRCVRSLDRDEKVEAVRPTVVDLQ